MMVHELIEKLKELDPEMEVLKTDCCYGPDDADVAVQKRSINSYHRLFVDEPRFPHLKAYQDQLEFADYVVIF